MRYNRLGKTDLSVSELGFGAWAIGGNRHSNSYGPTDDAMSASAIRTALDLGCTFFDTADVYGHGHSEALLGRTLSDARKLNDVVIASKVGSNFSGAETVRDFSEGHLTRAIEGTLLRLGRDHLDLYQLHNPPVETVEDGRVFQTLDALKRQGKIRHYGVSIHTVREGLAGLKTGRVETLQVVYNLFSLLTPELSAEQLFAPSAERGIGLIAREPLASGFLSGKHRVDTVYGPGDMRASWSRSDRELYVSLAEAMRGLERPGVTLAQAALRFVLDEGVFATTIVGIKTPAQAREDFGAADLPPLGPLAAGQPAGAGPGAV
jgi:aryl-alcohol dehydrogenase-like predicted oxidoreductase